MVSDAEKRYQARLKQRNAAASPIAGFASAPEATIASPRSESAPGFGAAFGAVADKFRQVVPEPVRDAVGYGWGLIDTPISQRIGINIEDSPERPGPGNEIENTLKSLARMAIEEPTRPSNYLIALRGASVASKLGRLGKAGKVAGSLVEPVSRGNSAQRLGAEIAISGLARGGSEAANAALPEDTGTPQRVAVGLLAGLISAGAGIKAISGISRGTIGKDILGLAPGPVRVRGTAETETLGRVGLFLQARAPESLRGSNVKDLVSGGLRGQEGEFNRLRRIIPSQANLIRGAADTHLRALGDITYYRQDASGALTKVKKASTGNPYIIDTNGRPQLLQHVLEFTDEHALTPSQRKAVEELHKLPAAVFGEGTAFGVAPELTELEIGQSYFPRLAVEDSHGVELDISSFGTGGRLSGGPAQKARQHIDPREGAKAGVIYADPAIALDRYASAMFKRSADTYEATILKMFGESASQRAYTGLVEATAALRSKTSGARNTVVRQKARSATMASQTQRDLTAAERAAGRLEASGGRVGERAAELPARDEIVAQRAKTSGLITEGNEIARAAQANLDMLRPLKRGLSANEKQIEKNLELLRKQMADAEYLNRTPEAIEQTRGFTGPDGVADPYGASVYKQSLREVRQADNAARRIERTVERLAKMNESLEVRVDERINRGELMAERGTIERADLVESRRTERAMAQAERNLAVAEREFKQLEREASRSTNRAAASAGRQERAGIKSTASATKYDALRDELVVMRAKLADMRERAARVPAGRATVDTGVAPLLRGVDFSPDDAKRITEFYTGNLPRTTQLGKVADASRKVSTLLVPIRAVGDMSSTLNQLGFMVFSHPIQFAKNFKRSIGDMFNPAEYEKYLFDNDYAVSRGVAAMGDAGRLSDFEFASWADRWQGVKQLQRHFRAFSTRNRIDIFNSHLDSAAKAGAPLSRIEEEQLARAVNRLSGIATSRAGDLESMVSFAPGFMRSGIETFVKGAIDGTLEGQVARQYLRNMLVEGQMIAFTAAVIQGRDPTEVVHPFDRKALVRGEIRLNPNFGTVRFAGQDISLYGRWDSLARLGVASMDGVTQAISTQDLHPLMDAAAFGLVSKGSPLLQIAAAVGTGATYEGNDPTSLPGAMELILPFTAAGFVSDIQRGSSIPEAGIGAAFNWFGGKARELTPFEKMNNVALGTFNRPLDQLNGLERQQLEAQNPDLAAAAFRQTERMAGKGDKRSEARLDRSDVDIERLNNEALVWAKYQAGEIPVKVLSDTLSDYQKIASAEKRRVDTVLGVEYESTAGAQQALSDWYSTYEKAEIAPGVVDYELRDQLEADLLKRIQAGAYGNPQAAQSAVDGRRKTQHAPGVDQFYAQKQYISESGYYDIRNSEFAKVAKIVTRIAGKPVTSYGALMLEMENARKRGDKGLYERLNTVQNAIDRRVKPLQQRIRLRDQSLDEALQATRGLVPIREQMRA